MLGNVWLAVSLVLFMWWFLTGIILVTANWAGNKEKKTQWLLGLVSIPVLMFSFFSFKVTSLDASIFGVYGAFFSSLAIWGWFEFVFLTGLLTGPNQHESPQNINIVNRFNLAWSAVAYYEFVLLLTVMLLFYFSYSAVNLFGLLAFLVLYGARISAKLNCFLGVPNINIEFLPKSIGYMQSHFKISSASKFFPVSVIGLTGCSVFWLERFLTTKNIPSESVGFLLLLTLTLLALLEHLFMVWSWPDAVLWRWMMPKSFSAKE